MSTFHPLRVAALHRDTPDAVHLSFDVPPDAQNAFAFKPGQFLTLKVMDKGVEHRRTYSITSSPASGDLAIAVRRVEGGVISNALNDQAKVGDVFEVMPPEGRFTLPHPSPELAAKNYLAIAAGSGITPIISMIRHALETEPEASFTLIYGNRSMRSMMFRDSLFDLKDRFLGRLTLITVLSGEEQDVPLLAGRIDGAKLLKLVPSLLPVPMIDAAFLCGPDTLIKEAMGALKTLGVPREKIRFEFFTRGRPEGAGIPASKQIPAREAAQEQHAGARITAILDGQRHVFTLKAQETVIEGAIRSGISLPYSCRGGMCCTCRAKIVEGAAAMRANYSLDAAEAAAGFVLTCQAVPSTAQLTVDYDAV